jgi:hypothetical protein
MTQIQGVASTDSPSIDACSWFAARTRHREETRVDEGELSAIGPSRARHRGVRIARPDAGRPVSLKETGTRSVTERAAEIRCGFRARFLSKKAGKATT